ncbi:MAG: Arm DNA-binding domain-containing protein [Rhizomicrobium sp.]
MAPTDTKLRSLKATGTRFELSDRDGLVLRVSQSGTMSWTVYYRVHAAGDTIGSRVASLAGVKRRATLGSYPNVSLSVARKRAVEIKQQAKAGLDPSLNRAATPTTEKSVSSLIARYAKAHLYRNLRSGANIEKLLKLHVEPAMGSKDVVSVTRGDLVTLLEDVRVPKIVKLTSTTGRPYNVTRGGPGAAAEVRKWTRALFQYALDVAVMDSNLFVGVKTPDKHRARSRFLTMDEVRAAWTAAADMAYRSGHTFNC